MHQFVEAYVQSKKGTLSEQSSEVFLIKLPGQAKPSEYTYNPAVSREKNATLLTPGSPAFQQIFKDCLANGVLCQIELNPKGGSLESLLKHHFGSLCDMCDNCEKITVGGEITTLCEKPDPCYHQIKNGKIKSFKIMRKEPTRYLQYYFAAAFYNKLRPKNEELVTITLNEDGNVCKEGFSVKTIASSNLIEVQDMKFKIPTILLEKLDTVCNNTLDDLLKEKLLLFDLPLVSERKAKLNAFERRLKRERRELLLSRKHDTDPIGWQKNHEALLKREEESFITSLMVKLVNLLIINTSKVSFELTLDNNATIRSNFVLGMDVAPTVTCQVCKSPITEGYATEDALYVCHDCMRQSMESGKIYSKKVALRLDETLNEYIEQDAGFICTVCGKRHSKLLEFKCSHDNSSVCIYHYGLCDVCKKPFSKLNLAHTEEFKRQLCPAHTAKCENCQSVTGVDEVKVSKVSGRKLCGNCLDKPGGL